MSYDPTLGTPLDHVRLLIPDNVVASEKFTDDEINALLGFQVSDFGRSTECAKYFVAAQLVRVLVSKHGLTGGDVTVKKVEDLTVEFGGRQTTLAELQLRADKLLADGRLCVRRQKIHRPSFFRTGGRTLPKGVVW